MTAIVLPGWTCPCGRFNGAEKEWRTECSACGLRESASPGIRPSDVAAGTKACCERKPPRFTADEARALLAASDALSGEGLEDDAPGGAWAGMVAECKEVT